MPAKREVVTRSPKRSVGLINCPWFQEKPIAHESRLEKHFVLRAMLYPGLKSIEHQPFRMDLAKHGKYYTPDFLLTFSSGEYEGTSHFLATASKCQDWRAGKSICNHLLEGEVP